MRRGVVLACLCAAVSVAPLAHAAPKKRPVPDYDGRAPAGTTAGDVALWVPRVVLFVPRVVVDYGLRYPFGWLTRNAESSRTARRVIRFLFLQPKTPTPSIYPVALYDFGAKPSIGLRLVWGDGFLTPGSKLSLKVGTGGLDWWRADAGVRLGLGRAFASVDAGARRQPDFRFYGIGPRTPPEAAARYGAGSTTAQLAGGGKLATWAEPSVYGAVTKMTFRESSYGADPSIETRVAEGLIDMLPPGYPAGFTALRLGGRLALDTREGAKRARSGARLDARLERVWDADDRDRAWTRFEARAGGAFLLDPVAERQLDVKLEVQLVEPGDASTLVPFTELASPAGSARLRGFPSGRLYDASAASLVVEYQWPLAAWLDTRAHVGVGNVFGPRWSGMSLGALRGSAGLSLLLAGLSSERQVELSTAFGTEPFEAGWDVSSFRLLIGFAHDY